MRPMTGWRFAHWPPCSIWPCCADTSGSGRVFAALPLLRLCWYGICGGHAQHHGVSNCSLSKKAALTMSGVLAVSRIQAGDAGKFANWRLSCSFCENASMDHRRRPRPIRPMPVIATAKSISSHVDANMLHGCEGAASGVSCADGHIQRTFRLAPIRIHVRILGNASMISSRACQDKQSRL